MTTTTKIGGIGLLGLVSVLAAGPAAAQKAQSADGTAQASAHVLESEARERATQAGEFLQAGALLREAAQLRSTDDPEAVRDLRDAALFAFYGGNRRQAVADMATAGARAADLRRQVEALRNYLDAAWMAARIGEGRRALELAHRAREIFRNERLDAGSLPDLAVRLQELEGLSDV